MFTLMKDCMKKTLGHASLRLLFVALILAAFAAAAWWVKPSLFPPSLHGAYKYQGKFVSGCMDTMLDGVYYRDALDLEPINEKKLSAGYIKVFFADKECTAKEQLVQMRLPKGTWEIVSATTPERNPLQADKILVTLPDGAVNVVIKNAQRAGQTDKSFYIKKASGNENLIDIDKMAQGFTAKELHLMDGDRVYMHAQKGPTDALGYPSEIDKNDFFTRF
jgi:hypothetical protein